MFASLLITSIFLVWVIAADNSGALLRSVQTRANILFGGWYIYVSTFYLLICLGLAIWPKSGSIKLGLPFEQSCVDFHKTKRSVRTASSEQVRQPIYKSGLEQWRHFDPWLDPLKSALGPVLDRYPI